VGVPCGGGRAAACGSYGGNEGENSRKFRQ